MRSRKGLGAWGQAVGTGREGEILSTRVCVGGDGGGGAGGRKRE